MKEISMLEKEPSLKILWITPIWPEITSSAAGVRTHQLLTILKRRGYEVTINSPCRTNAFRNALENERFSTVSYKPNDSEFDSYISSLNPNIVIFERFMIEEQFGWRVKEKCPDAVRILDTIDLHFLRRARERKLEHIEKDSLVPSPLLPYELRIDDSLREIAAIYRSDLSLILSKFEMDLLTSEFGVPEELMTLCRFSPPLSRNVSGFESRKNFVAIGNFRHAPNVDSYRILQSGLWKSIRQHIESLTGEKPELHIYGAYVPREFMKLDNESEGFRIKGWSGNAQETLQQYRLNLAPLRFGAGIKGKILDGWAAGTPCVASSIAAEGMYEKTVFGGIIEDNIDLYVSKAARLYSDQSSWEESQKNGYYLLENLFAEEVIEKNFIEALGNCVKDRKERRMRNFIGDMLWYHQNRSTEYFSRWIEVKDMLKCRNG